VATLRNALLLEASPHDEDQWQDFVASLEENFDTARALVVLHRWASDGQVELLRRGMELFGLLEDEVEAPDEVHALAAQRVEAKAQRQFDVADELRDQILALGWTVRDAVDGYRLIRTDTP